MKPVMLIPYVFLTVLSHAQIPVNNPATQYTWLKKRLPVDFIENVGQANDCKLPNKEIILYTANLNGFQFHFTRLGYTVVKRELVEKSAREFEKEIKRMGLEEKKDKGESLEEMKKEHGYKVAERFCEMKFVGGSTGAELVAENPVPHYYA